MVFVDDSTKERGLKGPSSSLLFWKVLPIRVSKAGSENFGGHHWGLIVIRCFPKILSEASDLKRTSKGRLSKRTAMTVGSCRALHSKIAFSFEQTCVSGVFFFRRSSWCLA